MSYFRKNKNNEPRLLSKVFLMSGPELYPYLKVSLALLIGARQVDVGVRDAVGCSKIPRRRLPPVELVLQRLLTDKDRDISSAYRKDKTQVRSGVI